MRVIFLGRELAENDSLASHLRVPARAAAAGSCATSSADADNATGVTLHAVLSNRPPNVRGNGPGGCSNAGGLKTCSFFAPFLCQWRSESTWEYGDHSGASPLAAALLWIVCACTAALVQRCQSLFVWGAHSNSDLSACVCRWREFGKWRLVCCSPRCDSICHLVRLLVSPSCLPWRFHALLVPLAGSLHGLLCVYYSWRRHSPSEACLRLSPSSVGGY